jgi:Icc-related predicted phosphoesterase
VTTRCFLASDLHGSPGRYRALWRTASSERPALIFLAGDLLPGGLGHGASEPRAEGDFIEDFMVDGFLALKEALGDAAPRVLMVPGNDDPASAVPALARGEERGAWESIHGRRIRVEGRPVYGYACVPPSPFLLKDWERYDVSRYVDPGSVSPEEGWRSQPMDAYELRWRTIARELEALTRGQDLKDAVLLLHAPPYDTPLDLADLQGRMVEHVPVDPHIGSIAVRRLIQARQPWLTLHGHVHESSRLTGHWKARLGETVMISAAHDEPSLCLVRFDLDEPWEATRELIEVSAS